MNPEARAATFTFNIRGSSFILHRFQNVPCLTSI